MILIDRASGKTQNIDLTLKSYKNLISRCDDSDLFVWPFSKPTEFERDYIQQQLGRVIAKLTELLNSYYNLDLQQKVWKIIFGNWIVIFLKCIYFREKLLDVILGEHTLDPNFIITSDDSYDFTGENSGDIYNQVNSILWNDFVFSLLLIDRGEGDRIVYSTAAGSGEIKYEKVNKVTIIKKYLRSLYLQTNYIKKNTSFYYTGLGLKNDIILNILKFELPRYHKRVAISNSFQTMDERKELVKNWLRCSENYSSSKDENIIMLVSLFIPKKIINIIETMEQNISRYKNSRSFICISNGLMIDDLRRLIAINVASGGRFGVWQHGGNYGLHKYEAYDSFELQTADNFFSWGEINVTAKKNIPAFNQLPRLKVKRRDNFRKVLHVITRPPMLQVETYSTFHFYIDYVDRIVRLINKLRMRCADLEIVFRTHPSHDLELERRIWESKLHNIKFDKDPELHIFRDADYFYVFTYLSTLFYKMVSDARTLNCVVLQEPEDLIDGPNTHVIHSLYRNNIFFKNEYDCAEYLIKSIDTPSLFLTSDRSDCFKDFNVRYNSSPNKNAAIAFFTKVKEYGNE